MTSITLISTMISFLLFPANKSSISLLQQQAQDKAVEKAPTTCRSSLSHRPISRGGADRELLFRKLMRHSNVPVTRPCILLQLLHICETFSMYASWALEADPSIPPSCSPIPQKKVLLAYYADLETFTEGKIKYNGRVDVIPPGIDLDRFVPVERYKAREKYGIPPDAVVLIFSCQNIIHIQI